MTRTRQLDLGWLTSRPIAHRGLHDRSKGIIENSSSAFAAAMHHDYAIECDLQLSADGEAMVFHDAVLDRLTDETGNVIDRSADGLCRIPLTGSDDCPQTLPQLFQQVNASVPLVIELKSHWDGNLELAKRACELTSQYGGPAVIMSFDPALVAAVKELAPTLPRGGVSGLFEPRNWPELDPGHARELATGHEMAAAEPDFMSYSVKALTRPPALAFRKTGKPVICWTVRDEETGNAAMQHCDQITFEGFLA